LPRYAQVTAVGGITPRDVPLMLDAGARAFGVGSDVYQPGALPETVRHRAEAWITACKRGRRRPRVTLAANPQAAIGESPDVAAGQPASGVGGSGSAPDYLAPTTAASTRARCR
jgi:hypothetical protein